MSFSIWFFLVGDPDVNVFEVTTDGTMTVGELKHKIKEETKPTLDKVSANHLTLHRDTIDPTLHKQARKDELNRLSKNLPDTELDAAEVLSADIYNIHNIHKTSPTGKNYIILVRTPEGSISAVHLNAAAERNRRCVSSRIVNDRIESRLPPIKKAIQAYLESDAGLPLWEPPKAPANVVEHIRSLKIPALPSSHQLPSLLLHNLGGPSLGLDHKVEKVFDENRTTHMFLCNTSGSGKTRLLFEGLWRYFGLYFTASTYPDGIGSGDLGETLEHLLLRLLPLPKQNWDADLRFNRDIASCRFHGILYARLLIFRIFLEHASSMPGGITDEHKGRWLLLQIAPTTLLKTTIDPFERLTLTLWVAADEYLLDKIQTEKNTIDTLLQGQKLFCVLDEAEVSTRSSLASKCLKSRDKPYEDSPILRELIMAWKGCFPGLIISGTGISMEKNDDVLGIAKGGGEVLTFTDLGVFDSEERQRAYMERYLPLGFLNGPSGTVLASRAAYWLHGRHQFTAAWLSRLLCSGFQAPHHVLTSFVASMTGHTLSDADNFEEKISNQKLNPSMGFNFTKLQQDPVLLRQIVGCVFDYIFHGDSQGFIRPEDAKLVEYGIARFGHAKDLITIDEPLALLAVADYFIKHTRSSLPHFLQAGVTHSNRSARGIALEYFGAYVLALAFSSPTRLGDVFDFVGGNSDLENETGHLVAVHKQKKSYVAYPVDIKSSSLLTHILGQKYLTSEETLSWREDPDFCFPARSVGADLVLVLQLSDGPLLRVIVQFRHSMANQDSKETIDALESTDPRKLNSCEKSNTVPSSDMGTGIEKFGQGTLKAGPLGVLRVLISYSAGFHKDALTSNAGKAPGPIVTADLAQLVEPPLGSGTQTTLALRLKAAAERQKRKRNGASTSKRTKRPLA